MHGGPQIGEGVSVGALAVATVLVREQRWLGDAEATALQPPLGLTSVQPRAAVKGHRPGAGVGADCQRPGAVEVLLLIELHDPRRLAAALEHAVDRATLARRHDFGQVQSGELVGVAPRRALAIFASTVKQLRWAILTVCSVLALAYVMNLSGQTITLGLWIAGAGAAFAFLSPIVGWFGTAVTGSDTSANSLFGALQVAAAHQSHLSPTLLAAANSSGGVMGKMICPRTWRSERPQSD